MVIVIRLDTFFRLMVLPAPTPTAGRQDNDDDPLIYLPCSTVYPYAGSEIIYGPDHPCTHLYVVITGTVQVCLPESQGRQIIVDIYQKDDFFGENALLGLPRRGERAFTLEKTMLMSWGTLDVEELISRRPGLGSALLRVMVKREIQLTDRLESLSLDTIPVRLARSLMRLSERFGIPAADGSVTMRAFTQEFLAQYIGTSREQVNVIMSDLRRKELVQYSRRETVVHRDALGRWIRMNA